MYFCFLTILLKHFGIFSIQCSVHFQGSISNFPAQFNVGFNPITGEPVTESTTETNGHNGVSKNGESNNNGGSKTATNVGSQSLVHFCCQCLFKKCSLIIITFVIKQIMYPWLLNSGSDVILTSLQIYFCDSRKHGYMIFHAHAFIPFKFELIIC